jgi:hypothetical protein
MTSSVVRIAGAALAAWVAGAACAGAADFDIGRYSNAGAGRFETFHVESTTPLAGALDAGVVGADTELLVVATAAGNLALLKDQMAFHHIAQGSARDPRSGRKQDWIATF